MLRRTFFGVVCLGLFFTFGAFAQKMDTVIVQNFGSSNFKATSYNFSGIEDSATGIYYFANESGMLEFDGSEWRSHPISNFASALTLLKGDSGKIYVGGVNEFGYFKRNSAGELDYTSLRKKLKIKKTIDEVWFLVKHKRNIYFASYDTVVRYDGKHVTPLPIRDTHLFNVDGKLIASKFGGGIGVVEGDSVRIINKKFKYKNDAAWAFLPGPNDDGKKLLMTSENGAFIFDPETFETTPWKTEASKFFKDEKKGFYDGVVFRDSLYACTSFYGGLIIFNKQGKILKHLDRDDGLPTNYLTDIFEDMRGNLWISTGYGISYLKFPESPDLPSYNPQTIISHLAVGDSAFVPYAANVNTGYLKSSTSIVFSFATPGYIKDDLQYSFYLKGFEDQWSPWKNVTRKEYTNLGGGDYEFYVKAKLPDGRETAPATLDIHIPIPWYQNKWLYALGVLLLAGLILMLFRYRTMRLKGANKKLELVIGERTKELLEQKEQLQKANKELRVINSELDNFVYRSSHDLIAPLKSLRGLIQVTTMANKDQELERYLGLMNTSILKLEEFIQSIMDFSVNAKRPIAKDEVVLHTLLEDIIADIKYYDNVERIDWDFDFKDDFSFYTDEKRLKIILSNLMTNAVKYHNFNRDHKPYIRVGAEKKNGEVLLKVEDNGQGIDKEHHEKIFDMFFRATSNGEGSGLGLYIVKDTAETLGGSIDFQSQSWKGTTFFVKLPLRETKEVDSSVTQES